MDTSSGSIVPDHSGIFPPALLREVLTYQNISAKCPHSTCPRAYTARFVWTDSSHAIIRHLGALTIVISNLAWPRQGAGDVGSSPRLSLVI